MEKIQDEEESLMESSKDYMKLKRRKVFSSISEDTFKQSFKKPRLNNEPEDSKIIHLEVFGSSKLG